MNRARHFSRAAVVAATSLLTLALPAWAAPGTFTEFAIPTAGSGPQQLVTGPDGNVWFSENLGAKVARVTPAGVISEFPVPIGPYGITHLNNQIWFGEAAVGHTGGGSIGRLNIDGTGYTSFPVANNAGVRILTTGPDGKLWFAEQLIDKIGTMTPTGTVKQYRLSNYDQPHGITKGPDNAMWFTATGGNYIGRIVPGATKVANKYPIPTATSQPLGITAGPDGNLWFVENQGNKIGRITPTGVLTEFPIPSANAKPKSITAGADGNLWFSEYDANKIGRITPAGVITEFTMPTANSGVFGVTAGPDSNVWFVEYLGNKVGNISPL